MKLTAHTLQPIEFVYGTGELYMFSYNLECKR